MKKETEELARSTMRLQDDLNKLNIDEINKVQADDPEIQEMSFENKCKADGVRYIESKRRLSSPMGTLPEKLKKEHKRAWEYVRGMYENFASVGEAITFSLCMYPGDADHLWEIPANVPVAVPRFVAKHLEEVQKYHQFNYVEAPTYALGKDNFTHRFKVSGVQYRGKFRPIGAFE